MTFHGAGEEDELERRAATKDGGFAAVDTAQKTSLQEFEDNLQYVTTLKDAFAAMAASEPFREDARKIGMTLRISSAEEVTATMGRLLASSPNVIAKATAGTKKKLTLELGSGAGELYDLSGDPDEMDNRFGDPALAARPIVAR